MTADYLGAISRPVNCIRRAKIPCLTDGVITPALPAVNVPSTLGITPNYGAARTKIPQ